MENLGKGSIPRRLLEGSEFMGIFRNFFIGYLDIIGYLEKVFYPKYTYGGLSSSRLFL